MTWRDQLPMLNPRNCPSCGHEQHLAGGCARCARPRVVKSPMRQAKIVMPRCSCSYDSELRRHVPAPETTEVAL